MMGNHLSSNWWRISGSCSPEVRPPFLTRAATMADLPESIRAAQAIIGESGMDFTRLDQIVDLQRLMGPVIAYKALLEIIINSADDKERRMAAAKLLDASQEDPARVAERLRQSIFHDLSIDQLQAIVNTGITDPAEAVRRLKIV